MLKIYNTLTKSLDPLRPIEYGKVGIYVCGMTVYDYCHIGHGRMLMVFDTIVRYLRFHGYQVNYVRNITDVDDKIIKRAQENNEEIETLTTRFIDAMHEDERALNILAPDHEPRATDFIPEIIALIERLIENDHAYIGSNGDVYYDVSKFSTYGELAHQPLDQLQAGARVEVVEAKKNPLDFVLWKLSKPNEPQWESPWGEGRPGWHIECSAMSTSCLGKQFDIHGGGIDLLFPHHQNELAQSEAALGCRYVNIWIHNGHLQVNKEKMSKSLGNFFTIRDVLTRYHPEVIRYFIAASHYRSPVNFSEDNLISAQQALERMYLSLRDLPVADTVSDSPFKARFIEKMDDDFNTPEALAVLFDLVREINRLHDSEKISEAASLVGLLRELGNLLGILYESPENFLKKDMTDEKIAEIETLIKKREEARASKRWHEADEIRNKLTGMKVELEDTSEGTKWRRV